MRQKRVSVSSAQEAAPTPGALAKLAALGFCSALWALFLWVQWLPTRSDGMASSFAAAIHRFTWLPAAGWGLVWGITAFLFPLLSLLRLAQRQPASTLVWAGRWIGVLGMVVVVLILFGSYAARSFCSGCAILHALVIWYGAVTLGTWQQVPAREARRGLALAAGASAAVFLLLLYPGLRTRSASETRKEAFTGSLWKSPGTGDPARDRQVNSLVASLAPQLKQTLSDSLYIYRNSPGLTLPPLRTLPSAEAPVRITEFTDVLCRQCAGLHATLRSLRESLPPGSLSIEARQYPLDRQCNPYDTSRHGRSARCLAAAAQICLERHEKLFDFTSALFENQTAMTEEKVYDLAAPYISRSDLERCAGNPQTQAKLADDLAFAHRYHPRGVPLVLVNGHRGTSFEPFLKAVVLTRGTAFHPAFETLPEPIPRSDLR
ncbi:MAG: thioredoxin domain-containing protein [Acidobacteriota bacterium]